MSESLKASFFEGNRQKLKSLFAGTAPIVFTANGLLQRNGEYTFPFRQDSSFWYLMGIEVPDVILVMDGGKDYLIMPERNSSQTVMEGTVDTNKLAEASGIKDIFDHQTGWKQLSTRLKQVKQIATLAAPPAYIEHYGFYTNPVRANLIDRLLSVSPDAELLDLRPQLIKMRSIKQPTELTLLQQAMDITVQALSEVKAKISKYKHEYEIEADLTYNYRLKGAQAHGFAPIIAGGKHATVPHYFANDGKLSKAELVVIDTGAEVSNYTADISRTYSLAPPTKRQTTVYEAVLDVQSFALKQIKPGITIREYENTIEQYMGEKLRELGLIKSIEKEQIRKYYPHLTSHYLGLDVHDIGNYDQPLEANMVITVEPGIYIPEESLGIRIEDDVLVTPKGSKIMTDSAPKSLW